MTTFYEQRILVKMPNAYDSRRAFHYHYLKGNPIIYKWEEMSKTRLATSLQRGGFVSRGVGLPKTGVLKKLKMKGGPLWISRVLKT